MARTGNFGGFEFDPEVFSDYMQEQPYVKNAIIASGIIREDATIQQMIGSKGNVGTMPFYLPIDIDVYEPLNNDGKTDNTPANIKGNKQTFMSIMRMKAFQAQDFTKELTGEDPLTDIVNKLSGYYQQVWQRDMMGIIDGVLSLPTMAEHITDLSSADGSVTSANLIEETSDIDITQKACGDMADRFTIAIVHSRIMARLKKLKLIEYSKFTIPGAIVQSVELPTWNGKILVEDDKGTVDMSVPGLPVFKTYLGGTGAILSAPKQVDKPVYSDYDPETKAGIDKLYTKQSRILHPNGFSINADQILEESPTYEELAKKDNWTLKFNHKNVPLACIKTNG